MHLDKRNRQRLIPTTENVNNMYSLPSAHHYDRQYFSAYSARLRDCRDRVVQNIKVAHGDEFPVTSLDDIQQDTKCSIIGIIFKVQELKPSILKEFAEEINVNAQPVGGKLFQEDADKVYIEDDQQKVLLGGEIPDLQLVTGIPMGVCGYLSSTGKFLVQYPVFMQLPNTVNRAVPPSPGRQILLISGINVGGPGDAEVYSQLLLNWLANISSSAAETESVARVVIAGNSLSGDSIDEEAIPESKFAMKRPQAIPRCLKAQQQLDQFLCELGQLVDVDVLPGLSDLSLSMWPQQPIHKALLPSASKRATVQLRTNPFEVDFGGTRILGTSGQNVTDAFRYCDAENELQMMERLLCWSHLAPTCPDTLASYPFIDRDPFIIKATPHVFFAGNQPHLSSMMFNGRNGVSTLLVTIPDFSTTGTCCLLDLDNLSVSPLCFK